MHRMHLSAAELKTATLTVTCLSNLGSAISARENELLKNDWPSVADRRATHRQASLAITERKSIIC
jgi:hypothetical protein